MTTGRVASLVFFDLDGTLIRGPSCESRFFALLLRRRVIGWRQLKAFALCGLQGLRRLDRAPWKRNKAYLAGLAPAVLESLARPFALDRLASAVHPRIKPRLDQHLRSGDKVILLTGAPDFIARPFSEALAIPVTIATTCAQNGRLFTAGLPIRHPYGETKRRLAAHICRQSGALLSASTAYANAFSDRPLLTAVGRPVAVFPDRRLRRLAAARHWEIIG